jgi:hypothetical protein
VVNIADMLQAAPSGVQTPATARAVAFIQNVHTSSGVNSASYSKGTGGIAGWQGVKLTTHHLPLTSKLRRSGAVLPLAPYASKVDIGITQPIYQISCPTSTATLPCM